MSATSQHLDFCVRYSLSKRQRVRQRIEPLLVAEHDQSRRGSFRQHYERIVIFDSAYVPSINMESRGIGHRMTQRHFEFAAMPTKVCTGKAHHRIKSRGSLGTEFL